MFFSDGWKKYSCKFTLKNHVRANSSLRNSLNSDWQKKLAENYEC